MNKQDLIDFVANKTGITKKDAHNAVDAVFDGIVSVSVTPAFETYRHSNV